MVLGCCRVVVAQWSERRQLRLEALGSIPSGYPCIFSPDLPPVAYHQFLPSVIVNQYIVTKILMCLPMLGVWRLGGLVTPAFPFFKLKYWRRVLSCCRVVIALWSERRRLRSEALDSIPSGYPCIFSSVCFYPDLPPVPYHQFSPPVVVNQYSYKNNHVQCGLWK